MKIALIHHQLSHGGGMETYFVDLIQECVRQGHAVEVFTAKASQDFTLPPGVVLHVFPSKMYPKFLRKYAFAWRVKQYCKTRSFDLTVSTTRSFGQDILITGGTHRGYLSANPRFRFSDPIESFLEARAYRSAQKIVAHSPQIKNELIRLYGLPSSKIEMLYPPVDTQKLSYHPHVPHQPYRLLFVSTSHRRKGGYLLLQALQKLPAEDFELWIAGRVFPPAKRLKQAVRFMGYVKDMAPVYQAADLLVLPSYFEPFGLVVAEALACGTPVLVSRASGVSPLVGEGEGLILEEQSLDALKNLLQQARATPFKVAPGFIERQGLKLNTHVSRLLRSVNI